MKNVFLDTNTLLHYIDFEQIDWSQILGSSEDFTITIASIVTDELDKHKYNPNRKLAKKAKNILPKVEKYIDDPSQCKFHFQFILDRPSDEKLREYHLERIEQDDCLLGTIMQLVESLHSLEGILLITNDVGLRLKAKRLNIKTSKLPETYLLTVEADEIEKENSELKKEIQELKGRLPIVSVLFSNETQLLSMSSRDEPPTKEEFVEKGMIHIKGEYPLLNYIETIVHESAISSTFTFSKKPLFPITKDQVNVYNNSLNGFYAQYQSYLKSYYDNYIFRKESIIIDLLIVNSGTSPAENIDVVLHFPDGFDIYNEHNVPNLPNEPQPPYKPKHAFDFQLSSANFSAQMVRNLYNPGKVQLFENLPKIRKTNSYEVSFNLKSLKHNQSAPFPCIYAKFKNVQEIKGFTIDYKLMISNLPKMKKGELNVKVENLYPFPP